MFAECLAGYIYMVTDDQLMLGTWLNLQHRSVTTMNRLADPILASKRRFCLKSNTLL